MKRPPTTTLLADLARWFEQEQDAHGTETAIFNLLALKAADDLAALGVERLRITTGKDRRA